MKASTGKFAALQPPCLRTAPGMELLSAMKLAALAAVEPQPAITTPVPQVTAMADRPLWIHGEVTLPTAAAGLYLYRHHRRMKMLYPLPLVSRKEARRRGRRDADRGIRPRRGSSIGGAKVRGWRVQAKAEGVVVV